MPSPKVCNSSAEAASVMVGGFLVGAPSNLLQGLYDHGTRDLELIVNSVRCRRGQVTGSSSSSRERGYPGSSPGS